MNPWHFSRETQLWTFNLVCNSQFSYHTKSCFDKSLSPYKHICCKRKTRMYSTTKGSESPNIPIYNWEFQKKWLRAVQFSKGGSLEPFKRVTSWIFTENNPEDECVATDGDEHGDTEEHGPHPLHQTPAHVPGVPPRGVRALRLHVVIARIQPATKYLKELI